ADALVIRYQITTEPNDVDEAIELLQEAQELMPPQDPSRFRLILHHCARLCTRFGQSRDLADLTQVIVLRPKAEAEDEGARELAERGIGLIHVFSQSGSASSLNEAMSCFYGSLRLRPEGHPSRSRSLNNLANALSTRFEQKGQLRDLDES